MRILLTRGKDTLIDEEDSDLASVKWGVSIHCRSKFLYAKRTDYTQGRWHPKTILMHRIILARKLGRELTNGEECDHINHDTLDNRRANLRAAYTHQNQFNQLKQVKPKSSQFKGICWDKREQKWKAQIQYNKKKYHIGYFKDEKDAAMAYDRKAKDLFGEFCYINFSLSSSCGPCVENKSPIGEI